MLQGKRVAKTWTSSPVSRQQSPHCNQPGKKNRCPRLTVGTVPQHGGRGGKRPFQLPSARHPLLSPSRNFVTYLCTMTNPGYELFLVHIAVSIHEVSSLQSPETMWEYLEHPLSAALTCVPGRAPRQLWGPG